MAYPAVDRPGEASAASETSNDVLMMQGRVIRFDPTIGPHGAFCYEEPHSPVKVAPLQACESDTRSDASSETSSHARAPLTQHLAGQAARHHGGMQSDHCDGNEAPDRATAAIAVCGHFQRPVKASRHAASPDQGNLLLPAVSNARRPRSATHVEIETRDAEGNERQEGSPCPPSSKDERQHCGFRNGGSLGQDQEELREDYLTDADGQPPLQKAQQRKQSEGLAHHAENRWFPSAPRSFIQAEQNR